MYKEKIGKLIITINNSNGENSAEDVKSIEKVVEHFGAYFKSVVAMEAQMQTARFRFEEEEFRSFVMKLDTSRRLKHDVCLADINFINRLSALYNAESPFPDIRDMDRTVVADKIIFETAKEYFEKRR